MRGNFVQDIATAAPGTGAVTLTNSATRKLPSINDYFSGTITVKYTLDAVDTEGKIETGIGRYVVSTKVLTRSLPQFTWNNATPALAAYASVSALNFTTAPFVRLEPTAEDDLPAFQSKQNTAGGVSSHTVGLSSIVSGHVIGNVRASQAPVAANQLFIAPFLWLGRQAIQNYANYTYAAGAAGSTCHASLYYLDENGAPRDLAIDFGTFLTDAVGWHATVNQSPIKYLPPGWYLQRCHYSSTPTVGYCGQNQLMQHPMGLFGDGPVGCWTRSDIAVGTPPATHESLATGWSITPSYIGFGYIGCP